MTDKRLLALLAPLALLAACNDTPKDDGRAASGEVLEGTVSDAMLPVDRVQSEPPLEDPEAFAKVQEKATASGGEGEGEQEKAPGAEAGDPAEAPAEEPATEAE
jgi:hypothetical protein